MPNTQDGPNNGRALFSDYDAYMQEKKHILAEQEAQMLLVRIKSHLTEATHQPSQGNRAWHLMADSLHLTSLLHAVHVDAARLSEWLRNTHGATLIAAASHLAVAELKTEYSVAARLMGALIHANPQPSKNILDLYRAYTLAATLAPIPT